MTVIPYNEKKLAVAVLTGAGSQFVDPLIKCNVNVVGIAEFVNYHGRRPVVERTGLDFLSSICKDKFVSLERLARNKGISYFDCNGEYDARFRNWLNNLKPDVLVVYKSKLLPPEIFEIPPYGAINLHPSLLPRYRGLRPIFWMHYNKDLDGGVTIHQIDKGVDTGPILAQAGYRIPLGATECEVERATIFKLGIPLLIKTLQQMARGQISARRPDASEPSSYFGGDISVQRFTELIDWDEFDIHHLWHILRCTDHWQKVYLPDHLKSHFTYWRIGEVERFKSYGPHGVLLRDRLGYYLSNKAGKIRVHRNISKIGIATYGLRKLGNAFS